MKIPVVFLPQALHDIDTIWKYLYTESLDIELADTFCDAIENFCLDTLSQFPLYGRPRDDLRKNLRSFPCKHYLIFYEYIDHQVIIESILHGSQDYQSQF